MADHSQRVRNLAAPVVERHGLQLLSVEIRAGRGSGVVRLVVDRKGGAPLEACQNVSREVSQRLDDDDPIEGRYALEVTSPGLDWPLRDRRDFDRVEGRDVDVCLRTDGDNVTQWTGIVIGADSGAVRLRTSDGERSLPYDAIVWAKQTLPW